MSLSIDTTGVTITAQAPAPVSEQTSTQTVWIDGLDVSADSWDVDDLMGKRITL